MGRTNSFGCSSFSFCKRSANRICCVAKALCLFDHATLGRDQREKEQDLAGPGGKTAPYSVGYSFLQSRQAKCTGSGKGRSAKNICPVKEQQVDCVPHGHPCKEYRIRFDPSDRLHGRRDTEWADPAQICAEDIQCQLLGNGRKQESEYIKQRFLLFATLP